MEVSRGLRLGAIGKTELFVDFSFLILAGLFVIFSLNDGDPLPVALLWIPTLFFSILIHELGHAAMIGALGFGRSVIVLGGFGGVTTNQRQARPWQNLLISLAGPVVGAAFALLLALLFMNVGFLSTDRMMSEWIPLMIRANIAWAIFNLLPIVPLDGGQVLRSLTSMFASDKSSFVATTWISMICAGLLIVVSLAYWKSMFSATIAFMLFLQNFQSWSAYRRDGHTD